MGIYRKQGKQGAYLSALIFAAELTDTALNDAENAFSSMRTVIAGRHDLPPRDIDDVCAKALRVERGRRIRGVMVKKSFDLSEANCGMLAELQAELGHATEVMTIRAAIHKLYVETFA